MDAEEQRGKEEIFNLTFDNRKTTLLQNCRKGKPVQPAEPQEGQNKRQAGSLRAPKTCRAFFLSCEWENPADKYKKYKVLQEKFREELTDNNRTGKPVKQLEEKRKQREKGHSCMMSPTTGGREWTGGLLKQMNKTEHDERDSLSQIHSGQSPTEVCRGSFLRAPSRKNTMICREAEATAKRWEQKRKELLEKWRKR